MQLDVALAKNIGGRDEQQDAVSVYTASDSSQTLVVLADGMGGHSGGALASAMVLSMARELFQMRSPIEDPEAFLSELCMLTHREINNLGDSVKSAPRSTGVYLLMMDCKAYWTHIGDSRLYHVRDGSVVSRSRDHSVLQLLVDMGKVDEASMGDHPDQNKLLASLGGEDNPDIDVTALDVDHHDSFILCSDGFWEVVESTEMIAPLLGDDLASAVEAVVQEAAKRGGEDGDNISVAYVKVGECEKENVAQ